MRYIFRRSNALWINMVITCDIKIMLRKISEKELSDTNFARLKKALIYIKNNLIDSDKMYFTVDSLTDINNITGSNHITLRKVNNKWNGYDKMYMDSDLTEDNLYQLLDPLNERKINHRDFYSVLLDNIHPFYDRNGRTLKLSFVSNFN